ncbi:MAG: hypothetical protein ABIW76_18575 [Fibrobacteria bacterium]
MKDVPFRQAIWQKARLAALLPVLLFSAFQPASARLVPAILNFDGTNPETLPAKLSQTGLYDNVASKSRAVTEGLVAFEVNTPLWSDGSHKERFITIPAGAAKVVPTDTDQYEFPDQTVLVKNFQIDSVYGDSATRFFVETRFLVIRASMFGTQYLGMTYKWRRDQSDADLVDQGSGLDTVHQVKVGGAFRGKRWRYPSQTDCNTCHFNRGVLGFLTPQLNRPSKANPSINQLQALVTANILSKNPIAGMANPFRWAGINETAVTPPMNLSLAEWKARSYFASNCSQCHGNGHAKTFESASHDFDFFHPGRKTAYALPDSIGGFVGKPANTDPRFPKLIYAGYPESSYVVARLFSRPTEFNGSSMQMPPLATFQPDSAAINAVKDWICSLGTRGAACQLPFLQADITYWAQPPSIGLFHGGIGSGKAGKLSAAIRGQELTITGLTAADPILSDMRGREIKLRKSGAGSFLIAETLRPGVYALRAGSATVKIAYSP